MFDDDDDDIFEFEDDPLEPDTFDDVDIWLQSHLIPPDDIERTWLKL